MGSSYCRPSTVRIALSAMCRLLIMPSKGTVPFLPTIADHLSMVPAKIGTVPLVDPRICLFCRPRYVNYSCARRAASSGSAEAGALLGAVSLRAIGGMGSRSRHAAASENCGVYFDAGYAIAAGLPVFRSPTTTIWMRESSELASRACDGRLLCSVCWKASSQRWWAG
jgi:hypothetical protein